MNKCASTVPTSSSSLPPVLGVIHGYVGWPTGLGARSARISTLQNNKLAIPQIQLFL